MKDKFTKVISVAMVVAIIISMAMPFASAAKKQTNHNISYEPVTSNASNGSIPPAANTVYTEDDIYVNLQVDSSQQIKEVELFIKAPGEKKYTRVATDAAKNFLRYTAFSYTVGKKTGTLYYKLHLTYNDKKKTTADFTGKVTVKKTNRTAKINSFIKDSRWKNGISWGYYQRPKISTYGSIGCCSYAADFVKYVYGSNNLRSGRKYTKSSEIKAGDVIYGTPQHWMCIVSRSGNTLKIAQGNCSSKVLIRDYTLSGNKIKYGNTVFKTFSYGYHYY